MRTSQTSHSPAKLLTQCPLSPSKSPSRPTRRSSKSSSSARTARWATGSPRTARCWKTQRQICRFYGRLTRHHRVQNHAWFLAHGGYIQDGSRYPNSLYLVQHDMTISLEVENWNDSPPRKPNSSTVRLSSASSTQTSSTNSARSTFGCCPATSARATRNFQCSTCLMGSMPCKVAPALQ